MRMRASEEGKMATFQTTRNSYLLSDPKNKKKEEELKAAAAAAAAQKNSQVAASLGVDPEEKSKEFLQSQTGTAVGTAAAAAAKAMSQTKPDLDRTGVGVETGPSLSINHFLDLEKIYGKDALDRGETTESGKGSVSESPNTTESETSGKDTQKTESETDENDTQKTESVSQSQTSDTEDKEKLPTVSSPVMSTYESAYAEEIDRILRELAAREPFSYDYETDPLYAAYKKQYLREADRTAEDTLGYYAGMTGGMPSTAAISAASQAANAYKSALSDKIPELEQLAYDMYLDEIAQSRYDLDTLRDLDNTAYNRWYTANRDAVEDARYEDELSYSRDLAETAKEAEETEALLNEWKKGGTILTEEQAEKTGYPAGMTYEEYQMGEKTPEWSNENPKVAETFDELFDEIFQNSRNADEFEAAMAVLLGRFPSFKNAYIQWAQSKGA